MQVSDDFLEQWEHIIAGVNKTDVPLECIKKVVIKFVAELQTSLLNKNIRLSLSEAVIDLLARRGYDNKMGARPLSRKIDELIRVPLSKRILFDRLCDCAVYADIDGDQVIFHVRANEPLMLVNSEGLVIANDI